MLQDLRPPNRPRDVLDGEASQNSIDGLKRSEEFWIPDGNIVLTAGETAFRVYRGLLALQSTVFAGLFTSSSPSAEECYDDCPLIRLTDSPQDLAHLLRLLLPTSRMLLHRRKGDAPFSLHQISAIIRLTHKYHVEDLLNQALYTLQGSFPTIFKEWEDHSRVALVKMDRAGSIAVVNLARLTNTPSLLPIALYQCCSLGADVVDGWKREDGTVEYLSPADLKRCIRARDEFAKEAFVLVSTIFNPEPSADCATPDLCMVSLRNTLAGIMRYESVADATVLAEWGALIDGDGYCSACENELVARDLRERERVWNRFPVIFDVEVPNWNQDPDGASQGGDDNAGENAGN